ncbi:glutaredoxin family protein [Ruania zhangjianzhongii]|uniref:glutaredoxin family protein n=1 Tax=Ruania zhangjianzhongii TaxID=2603206 RepID=UPI0011CC0A76|nr:glutaredoxin family protein [Ruania zhangjianzhongii]
MSARVQLLGRPGCHLCENARRVVRAVCDHRGETWAEVNVDEDPDLAQRYGELVPVVLVDGEQVGYHQIEPDRLRAALD